MNFSNSVVSVKFSALLDAYDWSSSFTDGSMQAFVSRTTGQVHYVSDHPDVELEEEPPSDLDDESVYVCVPSKNELNLGKSLALSFAQEHMVDAFETVASFFRKSGAYGKFKALLERNDLLQTWYDYEKNAIELALREWGAEEGIEIVD